MDTLVKAEPRPQAEPRTYYSSAAHYICVISNPVPMISNGTVTQVGGKVAEFIPLGDGWSRYVTPDPEEIAVLDAKLARNEVADAAQYNDLTTPDKVKVLMEREEKQRLITQNNALLQELEKLRSAAQKMPPGIQK